MKIFKIIACIIVLGMPYYSVSGDQDAPARSHKRHTPTPAHTATALVHQVKKYSSSQSQCSRCGKLLSPSYLASGRHKCPQTCPHCHQLFKRFSLHRCQHKTSAESDKVKPLSTAPKAEEIAALRVVIPSQWPVAGSGKPLVPVPKERTVPDAPAAPVLANISAGSVAHIPSKMDSPLTQSKAYVEHFKSYVEYGIRCYKWSIQCFEYGRIGLLLTQQQSVQL